VSDDLLQPILTEQPPPSRLQASQILAEARSAVRRRRTVTAAAAGLVTAVVVTAAFAVTRPEARRPVVPPAGPVKLPVCTQTVLAGQGDAIALDSTGRRVIVGDGDTSTLWVDGRKVPMPAVPTFHATVVNAHGALGGTVEVAGHLHAAIYQAGKLTRLSEPAGATDSAVFAINDRGDAVGSATVAKLGQTLRWPAGRYGSFERLDGLESGRAVAVADDGGTAGNGGAASDQRVSASMYWAPSGEAHKLTAPDGAGALVQAISGPWLAGRALSSRPGTADGLLWDRSGHVTRIPGFWANAVTSTGLVGGSSPDHRAALWYRGHTVKLTSGHTDGIVLAINAAGTVATGETNDNRYSDGRAASRPTIWHC
jgi:hypothetical protein